MLLVPSAFGEQEKLQAKTNQHFVRQRFISVGQNQPQPTSNWSNTLPNCCNE
jgi:hypothetical protein